MAINSFYQKVAGDLKKLGLIDYDLREKLSTGKKSRISRLAKEYADVIGNPENYHISRVGKTTAQALKKTGFKVTPTAKAIIPLKQYDKVSIKSGGRLRFESASIVEDVYLRGNRGELGVMERLSKITLKKNQMVAAKFNDNKTFSTSFPTAQDMRNYLNKWEPSKTKEGTTKKQKKEIKDKIIRQLSLVTVKTKSGKPLYATKEKAGKKSRND